MQRTQKELVSSCYVDVLGALHDGDVAVRSKALLLVSDMATRANLVELVARIESRPAARRVTEALPDAPLVPSGPRCATSRASQVARLMEHLDSPHELYRDEVIIAEQSRA